MSDNDDLKTMGDQQLLDEYLALMRTRSDAAAKKDQGTLDSTKARYSAVVAEKLERAKRK